MLSLGVIFTLELILNVIITQFSNDFIVYTCVMEMEFNTFLHVMRFSVEKLQTMILMYL